MTITFTCVYMQVQQDGDGGTPSDYGKGPTASCTPVSELATELLHVSGGMRYIYNYKELYFTSSRRVSKDLEVLLARKAEEERR